ncbi:olfactory receptor 2A14-like [Hyla sarda]|uniref:olfactory receptor 2A14-like n=1 Tax=Hyla sarda TaxID=327740 RepID=UPI0024C30C70|nr:olfactory receptor 2A14-like [Hyla sarda]
MLSMAIDNHTNIEFLILPFSSKPDDKLLIVCVFSTVYLLGILMNSVVIAVICLDVHLYSPMYLFFCNLSVIDICYTTVVVPKLLHILLSGNGLVSFTQCFTQMYFFFTAASAEVILFFIMGYDRYIAICHPLHYHQILSMRTCTLIMVIMWVCAFINSSFYIIPLLNVTFDRVVSLHQFFCDAITVYNSSHGGANDFFVVICIECVLFGLCPFFCNLVSYIKIFCVIAHIKSEEGRRKTLSTCSSHLIVMMIYYSTGGSHFMSSFYHTGDLLNQVLSMFYSTAVPMINPIVYSLRNNEIKKALQRFC